MTVTVKELVPAKYAEITSNPEYTAGNLITAIVDKFTATNVGSADATISINMIDSGQVVGNNNLIVDARELASGETYTLPEMVNQVVDSESSIVVIASAANTIVIRVSGREISG